MDPDELPQADEIIIKSCSRHVLKWLSPGLTRDDLLQEGRLALWIARRDGRVPEDALHAERYLARRALGAMLDANSRAWRQLPMTVDELTEATITQAACEQPDAIVQMRQAIVRIVSRGSAQLVRCLELLAVDDDVKATARDLGVSPCRVSQLRKKARSIAHHCW